MCKIDNFIYTSFKNLAKYGVKVYFLTLTKFYFTYICKNLNASQFERYFQIKYDVDKLESYDWRITKKCA